MGGSLTPSEKGLYVEKAAPKPKPVPKGPIFCKVKGCSFNGVPKAFEYHMKKHPDVKFSCTKCYKPFLSKHLLKSHKCA